MKKNLIRDVIVTSFCLEIFGSRFEFKIEFLPTC